MLNKIIGKWISYKEIKRYLKARKYITSLKGAIIKRKNLLLYSTFTAFILAVSIYATLSEFRPKLIDPDAEQGWKNENMTDIDISNFTTDYYNANTKEWELTSKNSKIYNKENSTVLNDVYVRYYEKGKVSGTVEANNGKINNTDRSFTLTGNVKMVNNRGTIARSEEFFYDNKSKRFTSSKRVTVTRPDGFVISGTGFSATSQLDDILFKSSVTGEVSEQSTVSGDGFSTGF